jgi:hypothetical protein
MEASCPSGIYTQDTWDDTWLLDCNPSQKERDRGRERIEFSQNFSSLDNIVFPDFNIDDLHLMPLIKRMEEKAREHDPDHREIKIIFNADEGLKHDGGTAWDMEGNRQFDGWCERFMLNHQAD